MIKRDLCGACKQEEAAFGKFCTTCIALYMIGRIYDSNGGTKMADAAQRELNQRLENGQNA